MRRTASRRLARRFVFGVACCTWVLPALLALGGCGEKANPAARLRLATTTSTENSGLLDAILPEFRRATGIEVQVLSMGTGKALATGEKGDCDVLLVNGGLGPTVDDLTAEALAAAAGVAIAEQPQALAHLEMWSTQRGLVLNAANRKQAMLPTGCDIIPNPVGTAVGFALDLHGCRVLCTPGVPSELERMVDDSIVPELACRFGAGRTKLIRMGMFGIGESALQQLISDHIPDWPASVELGFGNAQLHEYVVRIAGANPAGLGCKLGCLLGGHAAT